MGSAKHRLVMQEWLRVYGVTIDDIGEQNIRLDVGRAEGGRDFWRWSIRRSTLERLGLSVSSPDPR